MKISEVQPTEDEVRLILEAGFILRTAGRLQEASMLFLGVRELLPEADVPLVALGSLELQKGRFASAQSYCEEALHLKPDSLYARLHRAEALLMQHQQTEAEEELHMIIAADPHSPHSRTAQALLATVHLFAAS